MANYYVWSGATGANNGTSFTDAYTSFGSAVTAANADGDQIRVAHDHAESIAASTTFTFLANVRVICVNRSTEAPTTGGYVDCTSGTLTLNGARVMYFYGMRFTMSGGTTSASVHFNASVNGHWEFEKCNLELRGGGVAATIRFGPFGTNTDRSFTKLKDCSLRFASIGQSIGCRGTLVIENMTIDPDGSIPGEDDGGAGRANGLFVGLQRGMSIVRVHGTDLSALGTSRALVAPAVDCQQEVRFHGCKFGSGVVVLNTQPDLHRGSSVAYVFDCAAGDEHYHMGYYDSFGSMVCETGIYANDGASYDGTNRLSWKITTTAYCSRFTPFASPWFHRYYDGNGTFTPYIEILRDGSASAYQDDEVWGEWTWKNTLGSTQIAYQDDRTALLDTPADQENGVGLTGWTGESGTAWSGKLSAPAAITPKEIGHLSARVMVGEPSVTVYVDPTIRGVS